MSHGCNLILSIFHCLSWERADRCYLLLTLQHRFSPAQPRLVQVTEEDTAVLPLLVSANPEELTCTWLHHQDTLITGEPNQGLVIWSGVILNRS